jgi:hypothetical protein
LTLDLGEDLEADVLDRLEAGLDLFRDFCRADFGA